MWSGGFSVESARNDLNLGSAALRDASEASTRARGEYDTLIEDYRQVEEVRGEARGEENKAESEQIAAMHAEEQARDAVRQNGNSLYEQGVMLPAKWAKVLATNEYAWVTHRLFELQLKSEEMMGKLEGIFEDQNAFGAILCTFHAAMSHLGAAAMGVRSTLQVTLTKNQYLKPRDPKTNMAHSLWAQARSQAQEYWSDADALWKRSANTYLNNMHSEKSDRYDKAIAEYRDAQDAYEDKKGAADAAKVTRDAARADAEVASVAAQDANNAVQDAERNYNQEVRDEQDRKYNKA